MMDKVTRLYDIPNFRVHGIPTYTNTQISGPMRGMVLLKLLQLGKFILILFVGL